VAIRATATIWSDGRMWHAVVNYPLSTIRSQSVTWYLPANATKVERP